MRIRTNGNTEDERRISFKSWETDLRRFGPGFSAAVVFRRGRKTDYSCGHFPAGKSKKPKGGVCRGFGLWPKSPFAPPWAYYAAPKAEACVGFGRSPHPQLSRLRYSRIRSVSDELTADEIPATGSRRRFAQSLPCTGLGPRDCAACGRRGMAAAAGQVTLTQKDPAS